MQSRPTAAAFFVVCCLLLCGLILRREIAAHPLPPEARQQSDGAPPSGGPPGFWPDFADWHAAPPALTRQAQDTVRGELAALRGGDAAQALSYRSRWIHQRFSDPQEFMQMVRERSPEVFQCREVRPGPVWADKTGQNARAAVLLREDDGDRVRGEFLLVQEDGRFKISHMRTQRLPK